MRLKIRLSMARWIVLVSVLAALPLLAFSAFSVWRLYDLQQATLQAALPQRAHGLASAVEARLNRGWAALQVLANSPEIAEGDLPGMFGHAQRALADQPDALGISLMRPDGQLLFSTSAALGAKLPVSLGLPHETRVFSEGRQVLTPLFIGAVSQRLQTVLAVPVDWPGMGRLSLRLALPVEAFGQIIEAQRLPTDWVGSVLDPGYRIAARSATTPTVVGLPASPSVAQALAVGTVQGQARLSDVTTREGVASKVAVAPVGTSGWAVVVGAPQAVLAKVVRDALAGLLVTGATCLLLAGLAAWWLARRLGEQAHGLAAGTGAGLAGGLVVEFDTAAQALLHTREQARRQSDQLRNARQDTLTGLPGRAWFIELARRRLLAARDDPQERAALLFIDLDGFKQINDHLGHDQGDVVLATTGRAIAEAVRDHDLAGRLGGDEFVVLLTAPLGVVADVARAVAARVLRRVAVLDDGVGCSIGIALDNRALDSTESAPTLDELLLCADRAMRAAKQAGKNRSEMAPMFDNTEIA